MKKYILVFCSISLGATNLIAQSNAVGSGGEATGAGGTGSYSIGQIDYVTKTGGGGTITEGLQQPHEIVVITDIEEMGTNLSISLYPNPLSEYVILKLESSKIETYSYQLYDMQGKMLVAKNVEGNLAQISMEKFPNAAYFIKILKNNVEVKQFKIIKNK